MLPLIDFYLPSVMDFIIEVTAAGFHNTMSHKVMQYDHVNYKYT